MTPTFDFTRFPILTTDRLRLRQLTLDDADGMMALLGDPLVLRFLNDPPADTVEKATEFLKWLAGLYERHEAVQWAITLRDDGRFIGTCAMHAWDRSDRHVDIGYHILSALWGNGYATEATRAMIPWCFENLDVHRIQGDCTDGHIASERVMLKCGFKVEGVSRESCWEHGRFVDIKRFGLLRHEYEER
ncbi:MAG: GNAT family N-acetyltransferase [Chloroflexota bacterium]|nr:GNAT family N-acetyltransferase [Chloroflexota bacterium]